MLFLSLHLFSLFLVSLYILSSVLEQPRNEMTTMVNTVLSSIFENFAAEMAGDSDKILHVVNSHPFQVTQQIESAIPNQESWKAEPESKRQRRLNDDMDHQQTRIGLNA